MADGQFRKAGPRAVEGRRLQRPLGSALQRPLGQTSKGRQTCRACRRSPANPTSRPSIMLSLTTSSASLARSAGRSACCCTARSWPRKCWGWSSSTDESIVEPRLRSVGILASVRERDAAYVCAAHVGAARRAGVPEATIDILRAKGDPARLPEDERNIVTYVRQLLRSNRVDQPVFDALKNRHGEQWLVELTVIAHYFGVLSGVVNAFEVPAPPDGDKLPG